MEIYLLLFCFVISIPASLIAGIVFNVLFVKKKKMLKNNQYNMSDDEKNNLHSLLRNMIISYVYFALALSVVVAGLILVNLALIHM